MARVSFSQYSMWKTCPQQYKLNWYTYINSLNGHFDEPYPGILKPDQIQGRRKLIEENNFKIVKMTNMGRPDSSLKVIHFHKKNLDIRTVRL